MLCNQGLTSVGPIKPICSMLGFSPCKIRSLSNSDLGAFPLPLKPLLFPNTPSFGVRLHRRRGLHHGHAGGRREAKSIGADGRIIGFAREREARQRAVGLFDLDPRNGSLGGDRQRQPVDALFLPLGLAGKRELAAGRGRNVRLSISFSSSVWPSRKRSGERRSSSSSAGMRCTCGSPFA